MSGRLITRSLPLLSLAAAIFAGCGFGVQGSGATNIVFRNIDGPTVTITAGGATVGTVRCGESTTWTPNANTAPPYHVEVNREDGSQFGSLDANSGNLEVRIRSDGVVSGKPGGPIGPPPSPCT